MYLGRMNMKELVNARGELQDAILHFLKADIEHYFPNAYETIMNNFADIYTSVEAELSNRMEVFGFDGGDRS